ncbi:uncharacterized protein LOC143035013 [Oratosquilla oratoria]|uniref:uncharacterized protein LOC143035013 n=1 Tax=Oratosquilla oratoria TaxID=337810 RepID=UPI003F76AC59
MEDRKEEVQQDDNEEGKRQEGELEEKLWEVEEFLVTLVDNGRSVVVRKDDLPLLPRSTKDFTPFLTELVLKNVSPLRKADPDLLRQGREWLTERLRGGKELELHCIGNPDYRNGIVQVNVGARARHRWSRNHREGLQTGSRCGRPQEEEWGPDEQGGHLDLPTSIGRPRGQAERRSSFARILGDGLVLKLGGTYPVRRGPVGRRGTVT